MCVCVLLSLAAAAEDTLEGETVGQGGEGEGEEQGDNIDLSDILKMGECGTVGDSYPAADKMELPHRCKFIFHISGMQLGQNFLGDEGMEKIKKGDFSQVMKLGEQFLGKDTVNELLNAAADQFVQLKENSEKVDDEL